MVKRRTNSAQFSNKQARDRAKGYAIGDGEKAFYVAVVTFAVVLTGLMAHGASFSRGARAKSNFAHRSGVYDRVAVDRSMTGRVPVYGRAMALQAKYDSRPYWPMPKLVVGAPTSRATADLAIEYLIPCESGGKVVDHLDSDGKMSYGILQFQDWDEWERVSGITGDPDNPNDAIRMAEWGIEHGMIDHWGCANILKII